MHFVIERLLDDSIPDQDNVAEFEVLIDDGHCMLLFEADGGFGACSIYIGGKHHQV